MNNSFIQLAIGGICWAGVAVSTWAGDALQLSVQPKQSQIELTWPGSVSDDSGASQRPLFELQQSADLVHWQPLGKAFRASAPGEILSQTLPTSPTPVYYRLAATMHKAGLTSGDEDAFGYATYVQEAWNKIGDITPQEFQATYGWPADHYLPAMDWDPTTCANWADFKPVAGEEVAYEPYASPLLGPPAIVHFRLNEAEASILKTNGFVVSERLGSFSFTDAFNQIYINDRPVFVATDAILQAWHRSYQDILEELEEIYLAPSLESILQGMAGEIPATWQQYGNTDLKNSILDADYFVTVARSLISGATAASPLGQDARVAATLAAITSAKSQEFQLFGESRVVDFSQFTVRGHYDHSERLKRYFQAMMWCGRIDFRLSSVDGEPAPAECLRELGTAAVLTHWLSQSGQYGLWEQCAQTIEAFVGYCDSMNFAQLGSLLNSAQLPTLAEISTTATLTQLQNALLEGNLGVQNILSDYYRFPLGPSRAQLPRSFTVMGQAFVLDSWALSQNVFPYVLAVENGITNKVMRRIPSCLDTAFTVFGNLDCVPDLAARMLNTSGREFRDGLPYQRQLAAVKNTIDAQSNDSWDSNIYLGWLAALRSLSQPVTGTEYPSCLRTRTWAMKDLNTQMASWTHLRATTVLYAKQSYTGDFICSYPYGYVEPRPGFFNQMGHLATLASEQINSLAIAGTYIKTNKNWPFTETIDLADQKFISVRFLQSFAATMQTLAAIANKELAQTPLSTNENAFLKSLLIAGGSCAGTQRNFTGWYAGLYYKNILAPAVGMFPFGKHYDSWDVLPTDVHTDVASDQANDPGCVLHEGIGNVHMLVAAIDNGPDRLIYAGPVFSHYEFEEPINKRLTIDEWKARITQGPTPEPPAWVKGYLVPGEYIVPEFPDSQ